MAGNEKPIGVAIVVCDKVITEAVSQNKTLVSIFNTINSLNFPCAHERMSVYVALSNGQGKRQISLVLKKIADGTVTLKLAGDVEFESPNAVVELIFNMQRIIFTEAGIFAFEVWADGDYIFESRFNVMQVKETL